MTNVVATNVRDVYNTYTYLDVNVNDLYSSTTNNYMVLDIEVTNNNYGDPLDSRNSIILACYYSSIDDTYHFVDNNTNSIESYIEAIRSHDLIVGHNLKFDIQWLAKIGLTERDVIDKNVYDTYIAQWVLDGNLKFPKDLNSLALKYKVGKEKLMDVKEAMDTSVEEFSKVDINTLKEYCKRDVEITKEIYLNQLPLLEKLGLMHIAFTRFESVKVSSFIELQGMKLDAAEVSNLAAKYAGRMLNIEAYFNELCSSIAGGNGSTEPFNLRSKDQLRTLLFYKLKFPKKLRNGQPVPETATGKLSVSEKTLAELNPGSDPTRKEVLDLILEYNKLSALLSKNISFFKMCCDYNSGMFYALIEQGITATHRFSSRGRTLSAITSGKVPDMVVSRVVKKTGEKKYKKNPLAKMRVQMQNLPRELKYLIVPKSGLGSNGVNRNQRVIIECDLAQIEFRVAAQLARDKVAVEEILNGADVHSITAEVMTEATNGKIKFSRQEAKRYTFMPLYGGRGKTNYERKYCAFFRDKYKGISRMQEEWATTVANKKFLRTPFGMIYYWPNAEVTSFGSLNVEREVYNYPVQGTATAELMRIILILLWRELCLKFSTDKVGIINIVHDSIVIECDADIVREVAVETIKAFTTKTLAFVKNVYNYNWDLIPLAVGMKVGSRWGAGDELVFTCNPNGELVSAVNKSTGAKVGLESPGGAGANREC